MTAVNFNRAVRGPVTAVPIVAGKGVRLTADVQNNRWVVEADETVLWEAPTPDGVSMVVDAEFTLSEAMTNFEKIALVSGRMERGKESVFYPAYDHAGVNVTTVENISGSGSNVLIDYVSLQITSATKLKSVLVIRKTLGSSAISTATPTAPFMYKIIGINRINA